MSWDTEVSASQGNEQLSQQTDLFSRAELVGIFTKTSNPTQNSEYQYSQKINLGLFLQDLIPPSSQSLLLYRANAYY